VSILPAFFFKSNSELGDSELPEIFSLSLRAEAFTRSDILGTYLKILTDAMERTHGLSPGLQPLLWDNCVQSEASEGLITLLATAMTEMADLFLVYRSGVIRRATRQEEDTIRNDYKDHGDSSAGFFLSFRGYRRTELLRIYSGLEHCVLSSLNKSLNLAKAIQIKIFDLRNSVGATDSAIAVEQGKSIAKALGRGSDIMVDVRDMIETAKVDTAPTEKAISFLDAKRAYILSMPMSYISGEQTAGIGSTGEADMRAVERGLKQYWSTVLRPALKGIFGVETKFKSQDFRQITAALEALKTFDVAGDDILPRKKKIEIVARMFDLDPKELETELAAQKKETPNPDLNPAAARPMERVAQ
jgi:hypothetical protein